MVLIAQIFPGNYFAISPLIVNNSYNKQLQVFPLNPCDLKVIFSHFCPDILTFL